MDYRVQHVILLMSRDPSKRHTLGNLSLAVNISASRLRHLFKAEVGNTPKQYLKDLRLRAALELAQTTTLSMKQIMLRVGINDESHFLRDFKKTFGLTPVQCRTLSRAASSESSGYAASARVKSGLKVRTAGSASK